MNNTKKRIVIIISIIVLIALCALIFFCVTKKDNTKIESNDDIIERIGRDFYENYYIKRLGELTDEKIEKLKRYQNIGIKITIQQLGEFNNYQYKDEIEQILNDEKCKSEEGKIVFYPYEPYGEKDYKIEINLDCE